MRTLTRLLRDDEGQDLVEYVLLMSLIALGGGGGVSSGDRRHHGGVHQRGSGARRRRRWWRRRRTVGGRGREATVSTWLRWIARDDSGQDVVEYALLTAFFGLGRARDVDQHPRCARCELRQHHGRRAGSVGSASAGRLVVIEAPSIAVLALGVAAAATDWHDAPHSERADVRGRGRRGGVRGRHGRRSRTRMERGGLGRGPAAVPAAVRVARDGRRRRQAAGRLWRVAGADAGVLGGGVRRDRGRGARAAARAMARPASARRSRTCGTSCSTGVCRG